MLREWTLLCPSRSELPRNLRLIRGIGDLLRGSYQVVPSSSNQRAVSRNLRGEGIIFVLTVLSSGTMVNVQYEVIEMVRQIILTRQDSC